MVLATVLLHGAGLALGLLLRHRSRWWPRVLGLAIAGSGVSFGVGLLAS
jgi:urease accessory protein